MLKPFMKVVRLTFLFLLAFGIRCLVWLTDVRRYLGLIEYDGGAYISWGREMVSRIYRGDWSGFLVNPIHPPLGKIMIGAFTYLMDPLLDPYRSATLLMCIISSITSIIIYGIGSSMLDGRRGLIAWMAYTFDPFSIHWTIAWLDTPTLLFITVSQFLLIKFCRGFFKYMTMVFLAGLFYALALMTKFQSILFLPMVVVIIKGWRWRAIFTVISLIISLLNPQFWISDGISKIIYENILVTRISFQDVKLNGGLILLILAEVIYRIWGGYIGLRILPYIIPLIAFFLILLRGNSYGDTLSMKWFLLSLIGIGLTPRLIFPEYYYIYTEPPLSILISTLTTRLDYINPKLRRVMCFCLFGSLVALSSYIVNANCWKILILYMASGHQI